METIVANLTGKARRVQFNGRQHYVVPMTLIVPGVLNGSKGPLYYPPEEIAQNVDQWNNIPLVLYHPTVNGEAVSARQPEIIEKFSLGFVFNARIENDKLVADGYFDIEKTRNVDLRVLNAIESGKQIELSTGLFTSNTTTEGEFNGKTYTAIARNYRADHLAILPDKVGACSIRDGCGVLVNRETDDIWRIPEMALSAKQKKSKVDYIVANCGCWSEEDRETLNSFEDDKIVEIETHVKSQSLALNSFEDEAGNSWEYDSEKSSWVANGGKGLKKMMAKKKMDDEEDDEDSNNMGDKKKKMAKNEENVITKEVLEETVNNAVTKALESVNTIVENKLNEGEKAELIGRLTANKSDADKAILGEAFEKMSIETLRALAPPKQTVTNYFGAAVPASAQMTENAEDDLEDDLLEIPVMNFERESLNN